MPTDNKMLMKFLIVEDNSTESFLLQEYLQRVLFANIPGKIESCFVGSLAEARLELETDKYDLLLLDLNLPDSYGTETIRRARSLTDIPILVLSGQAVTQEEVKKLGGNELIYKPDLTPKKLGQNIQKCLAGLLVGKIGDIEESLIRLNRINRKVTWHDYDNAQ